MGFSLLRIMTGEKAEQEVRVPKEKISQKGIKFVNSEVNEIDATKRSVVKTGRGEFAYDYLVVALGAELAPETFDQITSSAIFETKIKVGFYVLQTQTSHFKSANTWSIWSLIASNEFASW